MGGGERRSGGVFGGDGGEGKWRLRPPPSAAEGGIWGGPGPSWGGRRRRAGAEGPGARRCAVPGRCRAAPGPPRAKGSPLRGSPSFVGAPPLPPPGCRAGRRSGRCRAALSAGAAPQLGDSLPGCPRRRSALAVAWEMSPGPGWLVGGIPKRQGLWCPGREMERSGGQGGEGTAAWTVAMRGSEQRARTKANANQRWSRQEERKNVINTVKAA